MDDLKNKEIKTKIAKGLANYKHGRNSRFISKFLRCEICPKAFKVHKWPVEDDTESGFHWEKKTVQVCPYYKKSAKICQIPIVAAAEIKPELEKPEKELEAAIQITKVKLKTVEMNEMMSGKESGIQTEKLLGLLTKQLELLHKMKHGDKLTINTDNWLTEGAKKRLSNGST